MEWCFHSGSPNSIRSNISWSISRINRFYAATPERWGTTSNSAPWSPSSIPTQIKLKSRTSAQLISSHSFRISVPRFCYSFHEIRMHSTMSIDADVSVLRTRLRATPLATKAGFLTKQVRFDVSLIQSPSHLNNFLVQGGTVKTWKQRWFVCVRNQLSYFESRADEKPINTIDLAECSDCSITDVQGKLEQGYLDCPIPELE